MTQTSVSVNSSSSSIYHCSDSRSGLLIGSAFIGFKTFLIPPLSVLILYLGHQRWHSSGTVSHTDVFTYHMAALELICAIGGTVYLCGIFIGLPEVVAAGILLTAAIYPGQIALHILTCVERYLAVVHPVTYLRLRQSGGVKIRNISTGCVWLLCFGWIGLLALYSPELPIAYFFCLLVFATIVISFCSLCVLCVLIRPGPGEVGGNRERVDPSKQRALHTIIAIMAVLWLWFVSFLVGLALEDSDILSYNMGCVLLTSVNWFTLPSSLVLPLLFLHRAGKLLCCQ